VVDFALISDCLHPCLSRFRSRDSSGHFQEAHKFPDARKPLESPESLRLPEDYVAEIREIIALEEESSEDVTRLYKRNDQREDHVAVSRVEQFRLLQFTLSLHPLPLNTAEKSIF
jgi:hypothetical protein